VVAAAQLLAQQQQSLLARQQLMQSALQLQQQQQQQAAQTARLQQQAALAQQIQQMQQRQGQQQQMQQLQQLEQLRALQVQMIAANTTPDGVPEGAAAVDPAGAANGASLSDSLQLLSVGGDGLPSLPDSADVPPLTSAAPTSFVNGGAGATPGFDAPTPSGAATPSQSFS